MATDSPKIDNTHTRTPGFKRLQIHESDAIARLQAGFSTTDELLLWILDISKFTLGYIDDEFPRRLLGDQYRLSALVQRVGRPDTKEITEPVNVTERVIETELMPGFNSARGFIRQKAGDRDEDIDASKQRFTALLPRVDMMAAAQRKTVEWALGIEDGATDHDGPVESRSEVNAWLRQLDFATSAFVPEEVVRQVKTLGSTWRYQLVKGRGMKLRRLVGQDLLPPMNRAINDAASRGMEQDVSEPDPQVPSQI